MTGNDACFRARQLAGPVQHVVMADARDPRPSPGCRRARAVASDVREPSGFPGGPNASITTAFMCKIQPCACAGFVLKVPAHQFNRTRAMPMSILHEMTTDGIMVVTLNRPGEVECPGYFPARTARRDLETGGGRPRRARDRANAAPARKRSARVPTSRRSSVRVKWSIPDTLMNAIPGVGIELHKAGCRGVARLHDRDGADAGDPLRFPHRRGGSAARISRGPAWHDFRHQRRHTAGPHRRSRGAGLDAVPAA